MKRKLKRRFYQKFPTWEDRDVRSRLHYFERDNWRKSSFGYRPVLDSVTGNGLNMLLVTTQQVGLSRKSRVLKWAYHLEHITPPRWEKLSTGRSLTSDMSKSYQTEMSRIKCHEKKTEAEVLSEVGCPTETI